MNPIQKYSHIIELSACILNMFVLMFLCSINFLISLGTCYTPKELSACILNMFVLMFLCSINFLISLGTCYTPKESK